MYYIDDEFPSQARCSVQDSQIKTLQEQLTAAEEKVQVIRHRLTRKYIICDLSCSWTHQSQFKVMKIYLHRFMTWLLTFLSGVRYICT